MEALEKVRAHKPEVIVTDTQMPNMRGLECTRRLQQNPNTTNLTVIVTGARADAEEIVAGMKTGAGEYLTKPLDPTEFVHRVRSRVSLHRAELELLKARLVRD